MPMRTRFDLHFASLSASRWNYAVEFVGRSPIKSQISASTGPHLNIPGCSNLFIAGVGSNELLTTNAFMPDLTRL
jgi:hypothetical protein